MARGMASRSTLSMVPAEERCLLGRDGLAGATYSGDGKYEISPAERRACRESSIAALVRVCSWPSLAQEMLPGAGAHGHSEVSTAFRTKGHLACVSPVIPVLTGKGHLISQGLIFLL